jgi:hypothetical protein
VGPRIINGNSGTVESDAPLNWRADWISGENISGGRFDALNYCCYIPRVLPFWYESAVAFQTLLQRLR